MSPSGEHGVRQPRMGRFKAFTLFKKFQPSFAVVIARDFIAVNRYYLRAFQRFSQTVFSRGMQTLLFQVTTPILILLLLPVVWPEGTCVPWTGVLLVMFQVGAHLPSSGAIITEQSTLVVGTPILVPTGFTADDIFISTQRGSNGLAFLRTPEPCYTTAIETICSTTLRPCLQLANNSIRTGKATKYNLTSSTPVTLPYPQETCKSVCTKFGTLHKTENQIKISTALFSFFFFFLQSNNALVHLLLWAFPLSPVRNSLNPASLIWCVVGESLFFGFAAFQFPKLRHLPQLLSGPH